MINSEIPSIVKHLSEAVVKSSKIDPQLFEKYNVKRGLRNADHTGVLVGLTNVADVVGYKKKGDILVPIDGKLIFRGIDVEELVKAAITQKRHGFDEIIYLLLL
jgi:citrate synthase